MADNQGIEVKVGRWTIGAHNKNWAITAIVSFLVAIGAAGFGVYAAKRAEFYVNGHGGGAFNAIGTLQATPPGGTPAPLGGTATGTGKGK